MMMPPIMFLRAGNAGLKRKSKKVLFQPPKKGKGSYSLEGREMGMPTTGPSARIAEMIRHIGGCGSFARPMRARSGFSDARNAGRPGENITKNR